MLLFWNSFKLKRKINTNIRQTPKLYNLINLFKFRIGIQNGNMTFHIKFCTFSMKHILFTYLSGNKQENDIIRYRSFKSTLVFLFCCYSSIKCHLYAVDSKLNLPYISPDVMHVDFVGYLVSMLSNIIQSCLMYSVFGFYIKSLVTGEMA